MTKGVTVVAAAALLLEGGAIAPAHFHHVHLNVADVERTLSFYEKFFGAVRVRYRNRTPALFTERSFILLDQTKEPPRTNLGTSLWHIGWSGVDGESEFHWRTAEGIRVDLPVTTPVLAGVESKAQYMYFAGPDGEMVEVSTVNRNHRFEHVHLLASDVDATTKWFRDNLGLESDAPKAINFFGVMSNSITVDNVHIVLFGRPTPDTGNQFAASELWPAGGFGPTEGRVFDHLAFSYREIEPVLRRMQASRLEIVRGIETNAAHGMRSFFVRGPDRLLIEVVEERQIPEGVW